MNHDIPVGTTEFGSVADQIKQSGADSMYTALDNAGNTGLDASAEAGRRDAEADRVPRWLQPAGPRPRRRTTTCTSASSSSRTRPRPKSRRARRVQEVDGAAEAPNAPLSQITGVGWISANTMIEGIKAAGRELPDPQGVHQQPAPGEGLHRRRVLRRPRDDDRLRRGLRQAVPVRVLRAGREQAVRAAVRRQAVLRQEDDHRQQDHQGRARPTTATTPAPPRRPRHRKPGHATSDGGAGSTRPGSVVPYRHRRRRGNGDAVHHQRAGRRQHLRHLGAGPRAHVHVVAGVQLRARRDRVLDRRLLLLPDPPERLEHRHRGAVHDPRRRAAARAAALLRALQAPDARHARRCGWCRPSGSGSRSRR